ncbi:MAG: hypothetical protein IJP78_04830 [Clostridia bacterium]|nr:hypothetical protein [Clostridia bacterium]
MKRFLAIMLAAMFLLCSSLAAFAEDTNSNTNHPSQMGGEAPEGMPPEMPEGGFPGGPGGTPPEKTDGQPGGPGRPGGAPGHAPGGQQSHAEGQLGSWSMGGTNADGMEGDDYAYDAALYVTADGINEEQSAIDRITSGSYDAQSASGIVISDSESGHNGILVYNTDYAISDAEITMLSDADGSDTCDFSGKGTAIAAFGSDANVTITGSTVHTAGVATMPIFTDDGATVTIRSSVLQSDGGTLNSDYLNTPTQTLMVAPPWILGIMGNSRCSNMMGRDTTTNVIDSETSAGAWAVLSTDAGDDMYLNVYNSSLTLNNADESAAAALQADGGQISETLDNPYTVNYGSGYGTYVIGRAVETFAGSDINVGTYATIFTGGSATYTALEAGQAYELKNHAGETTAIYEAPEYKVTTIHSDTFGFMAHQNSNTITLEKGTVVESGYATFLVKTGHSNQTLTAAIDDSAITNGGVLIQVMDNDDATNGGMMSADDPLNTNGGSQNFKPYHSEAVGFNTDQASADGTVQAFTFTNGEYTGNIYNASGSDGLKGNALKVTFGAGAQYSGAIASTAAIHVTYDGSVLVKENGGYAFDDADAAAAFAGQYQNTSFTINEYWSIGQVANLVNDNGANAVNITLTDDAVWQVTGTSLISSLTLQDQAQVIIPEGVVLTVDGTVYTDCVLTADSLPAE